MRRIAWLAAAVALLAPSPAAAKGVEGIAVCGLDGCTDVSPPSGEHELPGFAGPPTYPPPAAPFVEVVLKLEESGTERLWYVPSSGTFAVPAEAGSVRWTRASTSFDRVVTEAAARVRPYPPHATAASVGDREVTGDVSTYLDLFGVESEGPARLGDDGFENVSIKTDPVSPWALTGLWFYPERGLLQRGPEVILLPAGIARDLRAAHALGSGDGGSFDWPLVTGGLSVALVLALTAALLVRRTRIPRPGAA